MTVGLCGVSEGSCLGNIMGNTPLHVVTGHNSIEVVKCLLNLVGIETVDLNEKSMLGNTPLHVVTGHNSIEVVKCLLNLVGIETVDLNEKSMMGNTPLHVVTGHNSIEVVKCLLNLVGIETVDLNEKSMMGNTPLHVVTGHNGIEVVKCLLNLVGIETVDLNEKSMYGKTPLHMAAKNGCIEVAGFLLSHGASTETNHNVCVLSVDLEFVVNSSKEKAKTHYQAMVKKANNNNNGYRKSLVKSDEFDDAGYKSEEGNGFNGRMVRGKRDSYLKEEEVFKMPDEFLPGSIATRDKSHPTLSWIMRVQIALLQGERNTYTRTPSLIREDLKTSIMEDNQLYGTNFDDFEEDVFEVPIVAPIILGNPANPSSKTQALANIAALDHPQRTTGGCFVCGLAEWLKPPKGYVCHRFKILGHFIQHCPTNEDPNFDIKRVIPPTGIPKSMLKATTDGVHAKTNGSVVKQNVAGSRDQGKEFAPLVSSNDKKSCVSQQEPLEITKSPDVPESNMKAPASEGRAPPGDKEGQHKQCNGEQAEVVDSAHACSNGVKWCLVELLVKFSLSGEIVITVVEIVAPEKVIGVDLFYLHSMDRGTANVLYLVAQYLFRHAEGRKSEARLSGGHFTGRLIAHFGLVSDQGLRGLSVVTREHPLIDLHKLGRLNMGLGGPRPERQQVAADGAPEAAPAVDEGAQGEPAPAQAPQPPLAPQPKAMPQRIERLKEEVREL
ncbi:DWNN domain-containing protein [Tanacetum coccineum]